MPLISIIIPVYNVEKYILQTVSSAIQNPMDDIEVILVDDGSKDNSYKICSEIKDPRVRTFRQENKGAPAARNFGFSKASGNYVWFFDSDDFFEPGIIGTVIKEIHSEEHDCYLGNFYIDEGTKNNLAFKDMKRIRTLGDLYLYAPVPGSKVYKREVLISNNILFDNVRLAQDLNFYLKFLGVTQDVKVLDAPFFHYRRVPNSISNVIDDRILDIEKSVMLAKHYYDSINAFPTAYKHLYLTGQMHSAYQISKLRLANNGFPVFRIAMHLLKMWITCFFKSFILNPDPQWYYRKAKNVAYLLYNILRILFVQACFAWKKQ